MATILRQDFIVFGNWFLQTLPGEDGSPEGARERFELYVRTRPLDEAKRFHRFLMFMAHTVMPSMHDRVSGLLAEADINCDEVVYSDASFASS